METASKGMAGNHPKMAAVSSSESTQLGSSMQLLPSLPCHATRQSILTFPNSCVSLLSSCIRYLIVFYHERRQTHRPLDFLIKFSSASPSSPSSRKRQQTGSSSQPPPIAPAPGFSETTQNKTATPASSATAQASSAKLPKIINTEAANQLVEATIKSPLSSASPRKRKASEMASSTAPLPMAAEATLASERAAVGSGKLSTDQPAAILAAQSSQAQSAQPPAKKSRTNTPWTPAEERKLKTLRDAGSSWGEIAKEFPHRTEGSVKKHWYKDMHYADFAEDESAALLAAIREYEANKWKEIGKRVGKPAKACEQYAKEHFSGKL